MKNIIQIRYYVKCNVIINLLCGLILEYSEGIEFMKNYFMVVDNLHFARILFKFITFISHVI